MPESLISYTSGDDTNSGELVTLYWLAQTFTVGTSNISVSSVKVYMKTYHGGTVPGDIRITAVDESGKPSTELGFVEVNWPSGWAALSWVEGVFSSPIELSANTEYAIVITKDSTVPGLYWRYDNSSSLYLYGHRCTSVTGGATWTVDENATDFLFDVWGTELSTPIKPINPTPTDATTEVDFSDLTLSWEAGDEITDSFDVYFGPQANLQSLGNTESTSMVVPYTTEVDEDGTTHAYIDEVEVDWDVVLYWRVDAINDEGTTTGSTWYFDARSAKVVNPIPEDNIKGIEPPTVTLGWDAL